jgi:hypothetical protein
MNPSRPYTDSEMALAAVLVATGPVTVSPEDVLKARGATLVMEHDFVSDSWLLRAEPVGPVAADPASESVPLLVG